MDAAHLLDALRTEGDAALRAAQDREDLAVPHLDWTVADLVEHLGGVYERFAQCLSGEVPAWPEPDTVPSPDGDVVDWARVRLGRVVTAVGAADLDAEFPTWAGPRDGSWVLRRLANETAVHRWDLEAATGTADPLPTDLAIEVTDEFLTAVVANRGLPGV
ncbi:MAG: maleylpyruvate isomerase family mycothiol-dependent enzyme, partial [Actinomycetota bacterium]